MAAFGLQKAWSCRISPINDQAVQASTVYKRKKAAALEIKQLSIREILINTSADSSESAFFTLKSKILR